MSAIAMGLRPTGRRWQLLSRRRLDSPRRRHAPETAPWTKSSFRGSQPSSSDIPIGTLWLTVSSPSSTSASSRCRSARSERAEYERYSDDVVDRLERLTQRYPELAYAEYLFEELEEIFDRTHDPLVRA